jgi:uncharacterized damage-inducible protein DinB
MAEILRLDPDVIRCREPLVGRYLTMLADCRQETIEAIRKTREDLLYWRRNDFDSSISDLLYHIALVEADWLHTEVLETPLPESLKQHLPYDDRDPQGRLIHVGAERLEDSLERLEKVRGMLTAAFAAMDLADFKRLRHMARYDVNPEWVLHHLLQHEAEHRGQINTMRRLGMETKPVSL